MNDNVKEGIIIFIIAILISVMFNSCAKAWTWEDFHEYCIYTKNMGTYTDTNNIVKYIANNWNHVDTQVRRFINPEDYNNFIITSNPTSTWQVCFYNGTLTYNINNGYLSWSGNHTFRCIIQYTFNNTANDYGNLNVTDIQYAALRGLIDSEPTSGSYGTFYLQNVYNFINIIPRDNLKTSNLPWYIADGRIGHNYINNNWKFYLNWSGYKKELQENKTITTPYILSQLSVPNLIDLVHEDTYYITLEDENGNIKLTSIDFTLDWENIEEPPGEISSGTITNPSGEITGNIDLTGIENGINNLPQNIGKEFYNEESGEKGIIQKVYEDLFTLKSGEAKAKVENFYNEIGYNSEEVSGELQEALAGLDVINGNFGDFIISWNSYNPNLTVKGQQVDNQGNMIPSGEINFSKFERENTAVQEIMKYVRAILSFSLFVMLGKNFWNTLMKTLGISTSVYDKATEENKTAINNDKNGK